MKNISMKKISLCCLSMLLNIAILTSAKTVYFLPAIGPNAHKMFYDPYCERDETAKPLCRLREALERQGYKVKFAYSAHGLQDVAAFISFNAVSIAGLDCIPLNKRWMFAWEPPHLMPSLYDKNLVRQFGKIFVMFDDLIDNQRYFKFYYPQPRQRMLENIPTFHEKKFCVMIASNRNDSIDHPSCLFNERQKIASFFETKPDQEFALYGRDWNGRRNWKGKVSGKWEVFKQYKFCICYENMRNQNGYITEKIFDAMVAGCVPVYWGASNITSSVPKECFIDRRDFDSNEALYQFLKNISEKQYEQYLQAIRAYFSSPSAYFYSIDNFVNIITSSLKSVN